MGIDGFREIVMDLFITCDANWEARINKVLYALQDTGCQAFFAKRNYGDPINGIRIVLMCRYPYLKFKQRIRFYKKDGWLYLDLMLDINQFESIDQNERNKIVAKKFIDEVPAIIAKYKFKGFDLQRFTIDLSKFMKKLIV